MTTPEFDSPIITPFVIPTVLTALWTTLRHPDSWELAVATAIKLGGDFDTLGAIVGSMLRAHLGVDAIPSRLAKNVLNAERIKRLAWQYHQLLGTSSNEQ